MIRIIGVQKSENPDREFVLLQNQGNLIARLRGHVVLCESVVETGNFGIGAHVFGDEVDVPPGKFVALYTGAGEPRWVRTKDGQMMYRTYMNWERPVWSLCRTLRILNTQHTLAERPVAASLR